ncbi:sugar 3,4-ketoisomerase [Photobacterium iliopiscarium]|jgi:dTDP-4-dehydrorhamnose 3,5-epimerase-like enzyme|uniref:sugar 3,4-ketoisomerase n=1 Tax=Photobacterium iliopiscarium TaxID=56192 RepID=UPI0005D37DC9|nr:FdtA/QdtA family cupin domain-containing protein [Photobacterium iliopiscarium]KJG13751.1 dTDP-6-deoxy-3,4-keto-hexulose isomerase [Photobacterium iliopiscarium]PST87785.1 WxcM-like domain-containing protein [Photobacterium iliopiscarium]PSU01195.1 WxcM-like domain-containing protein [Photobacterium iliopiscarium]PSV83894.1 WxcM-like domain-containing protein [Photobacterium iliopiscarium]
MSLINLIDFNILGDERGSLVSLEQYQNIPFDIKRIYYIFGTKDGVARGFHAHKELKQIAICIQGECRFIMDNGKQKEEIILNKPNKGLFIDVMQWHEMYDFSHDCVLIVLASDHYDEQDYIRNYDDFLAIGLNK